MDQSLMPMLCGLSYQTVPERAPNLEAEPKLDGWRGVVSVDDQHNLRLFGGRNRSEYTGRVPYIEEAVRFGVPADTILDGELISPSGWNSVQSEMTSRGPVLSGTSGTLQYVVFDVMRWGGRDLRRAKWRDRRDVVELVKPTDFLRTTPLVPATQEMLDMVLKVGFEGLVIKDPASRYYNGKRSRSWIKIKPHLTVEAEIVGFKEGKTGGAWEGMAGAFIVRLANGAQTTVKCGTDERHIEATSKPERWLGAIIEINHHGLSKDGVPRSPTFARRRGDLETEKGITHV